MNSLQPLRRELKSVCRWRAALNWLTVALHFATHTAVVSLIVFAVDCIGRLSLVSRIAVMLAAGGYVFWRLWQFAAPRWRSAEGVLDVALLLERKHQLDGALVAGLQFDDGQAWGSDQLAARVVADASACRSELDYGSIIPRVEFRRHLLRALIAAAALVSVGLQFSGYVPVFLQRMMLREVSYPTRTRIEEVIVNSKLLSAEDSVGHVVEGTALAFIVRASGEAPDTGRLRLANVIGQDSTSLVLEREALGALAQEVLYYADGPEISEDATFSIDLGDARVSDFRIDVIRRPIVELGVVVTPPEYARLVLSETVEQERSVEALFGSTISFRLRCSNGKRLEHARMELSSSSGDGVASFVFDASSDAPWVIEGAMPPLSPLTGQVGFSLVFEDEDGLSALHPIAGVIGVRPDQDPAGSVRTDYPLVLPIAKPVIRYEASDDFGVSAMSLEVLRDRNGDETAELSLKLPLDRSELRVAGEVSLDLSQVELRDGDRISARLKVSDHRGEWPAESFMSEPVEIEIGNEAKVLRAILDADTTAERLLNEAIEEELGLKNENEP